MEYAEEYIDFVNSVTSQESKSHKYFKESLDILKEKKLINKKINKVKIYGDHQLSKALNVIGLSVTKGALKSIEESGGKVS